MVLEAVMILVDNSESSRNGDYTPTRFEAQADAISLISTAITEGNPQSSVGLMSMAGKGPEVLANLSQNSGMVLEGLHRTKSKIRGSSHLATGIQIAGVSILIRPLIIIAILTCAAGAQASPRKASTSTHHRFHVLSGARG
jgi:26S proteasome regulatory subunit N10